jgi:hypothetical protein
MKVELMALCDAATESQGKLNLLGAFDHLWARESPIIHPSCAIALRLRFSRAEQGEHRIRINFADADGKLVMPSLDGKIHMGGTLSQSSILTNLILNVQQLKLSSFGEYTIDLIVDGKHEGSLPLFVKQVQEHTSSS